MSEFYLEDKQLQDIQGYLWSPFAKGDKYELSFDNGAAKACQIIVRNQFNVPHK